MITRQDLLNIGYYTSVGAATCSLVGPLGTAGGAVLGFFNGVAYKAIDIAAENAKENHPNWDLLFTVQSLALKGIAYIVSFYVSAALVGAKMTLASAATIAIASVPVRLPFLLLERLVRAAIHSPTPEGSK